MSLYQKAQIYLLGVQKAIKLVVKWFWIVFLASPSTKQSDIISSQAMPALPTLI